METAENVEFKAKKGKKTKLVAAAVVVVAIAGAALYFTGAGNGLFKSSSNAAGSNGTPAVATIKNPERTPEIMGLVESVSGNEVKILLLDASTMPGANKSVGSGSANAAGGTDTGGTKPDRSGSRPTGQSGDRQAGQAQGGSGNAGAARATMIAELKKKSLGEETVTVPVGIQMTKRGGNRPSGNGASGGSGKAPQGGNNANPQGGNNQAPQGGGGVQASLSDLTVDSMVSIWLNPKVTDKKVAEFVSIR